MVTIGIESDNRNFSGIPGKLGKYTSKVSVEIHQAHRFPDEVQLSYANSFGTPNGNCGHGNDLPIFYFPFPTVHTEYVSIFTKKEATLFHFLSG